MIFLVILIKYGNDRGNRFTICRFTVRTQRRYAKFKFKACEAEEKSAASHRQLCGRLTLQSSLHGQQERVVTHERDPRKPLDETHRHAQQRSKGWIDEQADGRYIANAEPKRHIESARLALK